MVWMQVWAVIQGLRKCSDIVQYGLKFINNACEWLKMRAVGDNQGCFSFHFCDLSFSRSFLGISVALRMAKSGY